MVEFPNREVGALDMSEEAVRAEKWARRPIFKASI